MSILIKGMEMPKGCLSCDFCNPFVEEPYCIRLMQRANGVTRLPACPLIPIPDHGRLIDTDELWQSIHGGVDGDMDEFLYTKAELLEMIDHFPHIIDTEV